jgi:uncharacterized protein
MDNTFVFNTRNNNSYIMNIDRSITGYLHPCLDFIINMVNQGVDLKEYISHPSESREFAVEELQYYYKKYIYLKSNGWLQNPKKKELDFTKLLTEDVEYTLANLSQITFEITDACNLKCKYCAYGDFYNDFDERHNSMLSIEKGKRLITYLSGYWNSYSNNAKTAHTYISFYGGEPLLNISFIKEMVSFIKSLPINRKFSFTMTTNGILLDKYIDYLVENKFDLLISLDGNESNNGYRITHSQKGSFNKVFGNIFLIKEKYPEYFKNNVNFNSVLHNKNSISDIYNFFKQNFDKIPSVGELNNSGIKPEMKQKFENAYVNTRESLKHAKDHIKIEKDMFVKSVTYKKTVDFLHWFGGSTFTDYNELLFGSSSCRKVPTGTCLPFSKKMFVTVNGKILACEKIAHRYELGRVTDQAVQLDFKQIVDKYDKWYKILKKQCSNCYRQNSCIQCIFQIDELENNPKCNGYTTKKDFVRYLGNKLYFLEEHSGDYTKLMKEVKIR